MRVCLLAAFLACASAQVINTANMFAEFMAEHGRTYSTIEETNGRFRVFEANLALIEQRNAANIAAGGEAVHGITQFADYTPEEFASHFLNMEYRPRDASEEGVVFTASAANVTIDWRGRGVLTPIKDQGKCGSCWAFSTAEAIESYAKLDGRALRELSPQQLTSCDHLAYGCKGGTTEHGYEYVLKAGGLELESSYPYHSGTSGLSGTCAFNSSKIAQKITGYKKIAAGENNLAAALEHGPPAICLGASSWSSYRGGILKTCPGPVDHCVQLVAYESAENTWTIRNQWGVNWGERGYMRIERGHNLCYMADDATYPTF